MALRREMSLPAGVRGPVEWRAFSRLIAARSVGGSVVVLITDLSMKHGYCGKGVEFPDVVEGKG